ncbi:MarR family winged helix-turn-helix transcriptional regulator [Granulosicoccus antarcticus]|uniref:Putative HTH-type transcriptional regulator n=1 Tax=Granulosicoccus antarcticus IMCC3135 TaxID=1192854 RepID=A0A2Z2NGH1_9GAMM|nr:MarR family transcriptional regulator [Granulosicoccus antarcticus]ASJ70299.1 putative HTH-type transcriptional regulator [Granulosicoccus antarcticus IMCC3135]
MAKVVKQLDTADMEQSIGYLLRRASRRLRDATVPVLKANGLSPLELTTLYLVSQNPDCVLNLLATATGVESPAMNRIVNSLEEKGYMSRRKSDDDARYTYFSISKSGESCMCVARQAVEEAENKALSSLSASDQKALFTHLQQLGRIHSEH